LGHFGRILFALVLGDDPCARALHRVQFQGRPIVKGKRVTGFTNSEEEAVQLTNIVPFLMEDELKRLGGLYEKGTDWASFVITDEGSLRGKTRPPRRPERRRY
jgi:putative intracellular protease/amidase